MRAMAITPMEKGSLRQIDVQKPVPGQGEALVRVIRLGLDGTDKELGEGLYGEAPKGSDYLIVGHESFGVVEQIGGAAGNLKPGDHVVATVRRPDDCINCANGQSDMCIKGQYTERGIKGAHGYLCEYYVEKEENLVRIPDEISGPAVMLEPFSIVEKAVVQIMSIQQRMVWKPSSAIVMGTGTVGLFGAILLRRLGLDVVSVDRTERHETRDFVFKEFGIKHVNSSVQGSLDSIKAEGADIVLELTGNPVVVGEAIAMQKKNGICCLLSVTGGSYMGQMDMSKWNYDMVLGNRMVFGSVNSNRSHFVKGVEDMLAIEKEHPKALQRLITARLRMDEFRSYDVLNQKGSLKTVIEIGND